MPPTLTCHERLRPCASFQFWHARCIRSIYEIPILQAQAPNSHSYGGWFHNSRVHQTWASAAVLVKSSADDWRERRVSEWLLLLLRFAVTRQPPDRTAALAMADELDSLGGCWRPRAPRFFFKTTSEVCTAIVEFGDGPNNTSAVLRTHASRIKDPRLREAFRAAVGLRGIPSQAPIGSL